MPIVWPGGGLAARWNSQVSEPLLRQNSFNHVTVDVGQSALDAVVVECELFVIHAQQMQQCGVEVVPVNAIFHCLPADVVRRSVSESGFQPGTQPSRP